MKRTSSGQKKLAGIGNDAVQAKTEKTWAEWLKVLDAAGAKKMGHREIAAHLHRKHKLSGWWSQMVTVGYEQARGLREKYQGASGYRAHASKTVNAPLADLFEAWADEQERLVWLGRHPLTIRKAVPRRSMRITWEDGSTSVEVNFFSRGKSKSQVAVEHRKLSSAADVSRMKSFWLKALDALKSRLEA
jgi:uncharacterized protein YndB with AHSA1/START domain